MSRVAAHSSLILAVCCLVFFAYHFGIVHIYPSQTSRVFQAICKTQLFPSACVDHNEEKETSQKRNNGCKDADEEDTSFLGITGGCVLIVLPIDMTVKMMIQSRKRKILWHCTFVPHSPNIRT